MSTQNKNKTALIGPEFSKHLRLFYCALLIITCGCKPFRQPQSTYQPPALPHNRMAADAVGLEIGIAQTDAGQTEAIKRFWRDLDQQELSLETRQKLDKHGLKAAVMSQRPPSDFDNLVNPREVVLDELDGFQRQLYLSGHLKATDRMLTHNQVSTRQGQPHPIPTSTVHPSLSWTVETPATPYHPASSDEQSATNVRGVLAIRTNPLGDGSVKVTVQPQVHHGNVTQRYGATPNGFKFDQQQTVSVLESLEFDVSLRSGETLVIGPTAEVTQLGHLFFGEVDPNQDDGSLIAVAEQLLAEEKLQPPSRPSPPQDRLPDLDIDESKFDSIVESLDINSIENALTNAIGAGLQPAVREKPKPLHRLLMIRVVHTQRDDLFDQQRKSAPLSTSREF